MNAWEMTEKERSEYEQFVRNWEAHMQAAEFDPETVHKPKAMNPPDFLWWGIVMLGGCVFWAVLAVFCWGGNLVPKW